VPHIGHLYSVLLADAQARWKFLKGEHDEIIFTTGTDEHGSKIQKKAKLLGQDCQSFCDNLSEKYRDLFDTCSINYTDFIRTTEPRHKEAVIHFWNTLSDNGFIYKSTYQGWYSSNDECFLKDNEIHEKVNTETGVLQKYSSESGHLVEHVSEINYMFKLAHFKDKLKFYLAKNVIIPEKYETLLLQQIDNLEDLSVSRESKRISWGISVPNDSSQTVYVWLDALVNYLTVTGYPYRKESSKLIAADVHVVGKDILRFHAIYWPAFLMAADLQLPKKILCHGHWTVDNKKCQKVLEMSYARLNPLKSTQKMA
jgi:methionyl-tRNA synthetase